MEMIWSGTESGESGRGAGPDTMFHTSSHRRGQRFLLSILSSMLSDSWILLPTSLPKRLPDSMVTAAVCSRWWGSERLWGNCGYSGHYFCSFSFANFRLQASSIQITQSC